jgi:hypothetical protein
VLVYCIDSNHWSGALTFTEPNEEKN